MGLQFFIHKMREVAGFLKIMKGKSTQNASERAEGVDEALEAMKGERKAYLDEKQKALKTRPVDKVERESGRDVSAI